MEDRADDIRKIEAILFTTGRFMGVEEIAKACEIGSVGYVKQLLEELMHAYEQSKSALHIVEHEGTFKLNIRKQYGRLANTLLSTTEFDNPTTKTLAFIAYKHPVFQSEVVKARGNKAYDHIKALTENGLLMSEKSGRTRSLKLAPRFYEYFDTADDAVKTLFRDAEEHVKRDVAAQAGMSVEEVREREQLLKEEENRQREMKHKIKEKSSEGGKEPVDSREEPSPDHPPLPSE